MRHCLTLYYFSPYSFFFGLILKQHYVVFPIWIDCFKIIFWTHWLQSIKERQPHFWLSASSWPIILLCDFGGLPSSLLSRARLLLCLFLLSLTSSLVNVPNFSDSFWFQCVKIWDMEWIWIWKFTPHSKTQFNSL